MAPLRQVPTLVTNNGEVEAQKKHASNKSQLNLTDIYPPISNRAMTTIQVEPRNYAEAVQSEQWREAMGKEIAALEGNNTCTLEPLPDGMKSIDCRWIYKIKDKADGTVERYKVHLMAKGFTQVEGLDFHETFAPIAKLV
ncbi:UNVERIFIED_CONTAM: Retrovirus-related Pol polyprotein from transposon RE2 [Sesamum latifolium]|uniref:Retrovirus-related Pol polyprotein from transposon RE2 n=1 Tax=Sesamum latifolium TaxID=2727402 RepID=A0AAW2WFN9_9LAMI